MLSLLLLATLPAQPLPAPRQFGPPAVVIVETYNPGPMPAPAFLPAPIYPGVRPQSYSPPAYAAPYGAPPSYLPQYGQSAYPQYQLQQFYPQAVPYYGQQSYPQNCPGGVCPQCPGGVCPPQQAPQAAPYRYYR